MIKIRTATLNDINSISDIYNDAILNTIATFDTEIKSIENRMDWFKSHGEQQPIMIAEENHSIVGWASLSKWSDKRAYDSTAEISVYVQQNHRGKGIGKKLVELISRSIPGFDVLSIHANYFKNAGSTIVQEFTEAAIKVSSLVENTERFSLSPASIDFALSNYAVLCTRP